jgi:hypothetical protein
LGKRKKNYGLQMTVMLRLLRKEEKNTIMKISSSKIKQAKQIYLAGKHGRKK